MTGIGVIGYGYWGPNLVRNFFEAKDATVVAVSDLKPERLAIAQSRYPTIRVTTDHSDLINDPALDIVVIATPVSSHFKLAMQALEAGKHVFVEKPLATSSALCQKLVEEADKRGLILMVDHTFIYTGAIKAVKGMIDRGELGELYYYDSARVNLGLFQHDVDVIWDLAVHDLSIMDYIFPMRPKAVSATGARHVPGQLDNIAFLTLFYESAFIAHIHVNWLAPIKLRRTLIGGGQKMILFDELEPSEKVKVYDKGITVNNDVDSIYQLMSINYRTGDMWAPRLDVTEALKTEASHLLHCVRDGDRPMTDGRMGTRVVKIMEAASLSLSQRGKLVELNLES
jgi:predicted dehydrogenase